MMCGAAQDDLKASQSQQCLYCENRPMNILLTIVSEYLAETEESILTYKLHAFTCVVTPLLVYKISNFLI